MGWGEHQSGSEGQRVNLENKGWHRVTDVILVVRLDAVVVVMEEGDAVSGGRMTVMVRKCQCGSKAALSSGD